MAALLQRAWHKELGRWPGRRSYLIEKATPAQTVSREEEGKKSGLNSSGLRFLRKAALMLSGKMMGYQKTKEYYFL